MQLTKQSVSFSLYASLDWLAGPSCKVQFVLRSNKQMSQLMLNLYSNLLDVEIKFVSSAKGIIRMRQCTKCLCFFLCHKKVLTFYAMHLPFRKEFCSWELAVYLDSYSELTYMVAWERVEYQMWHTPATGKWALRICICLCCSRI